MFSCCLALLSSLQFQITKKSHWTMSFFFKWAIFKGFIEFVTVLFLFHFLVFWLWDMWDLSSPTRNWTCTPCIGRNPEPWAFYLPFTSPVGQLSSTQASPCHFSLLRQSLPLRLFFFPVIVTQQPFCIPVPDHGSSTAFKDLPLKMSF